MSAYKETQAVLQTSPKKWLVTGVAGFIGSHLLESLLKLDQRVVGLDNFSTGNKKNLDAVKALVSEAQWNKFSFLEGDICDSALSHRACEGVDCVLHQAALGSVPRSLNKPLETHVANVTGFVTIYLAARDTGVKRFVFASSCSVYGDHPGLPKVEDKVGRPLSPYAATKVINETYAGVFARAFNLPTIGLRYFNVFGPRQDPESTYSAVIPKWSSAILKQEPVYINGDGSTSRDFCYIDNVVQSNLLAAMTNNPEALNQIYNVGAEGRITLNELFEKLKDGLRKFNPSLPDSKPVYRDFRAGDVRHSQADISKARNLLGYQPTHNVEEGLRIAIDWYRQHLA
jgi:UDP-N-acetylglucosamine 4-epimerase